MHYGEGDDPKRHIAFENELEKVDRALRRRETSPGPCRAARRFGGENRAFPSACGTSRFSGARRADLAGACAGGTRRPRADPGASRPGRAGTLPSTRSAAPQEAVAVLAPYAKAEARGPRRADDLPASHWRGPARKTRRSRSCSGHGGRSLERPRRLQPFRSTAHLLFDGARSGPEALEAALALEPDMARAYRLAGAAAARERRAGGGRAAVPRARARPERRDTLFNLGTLLWRRGRRDGSPAAPRAVPGGRTADRYAQDVAPRPEPASGRLPGRPGD